MSDYGNEAGEEFDVEWPSDNEDREINEDEVELQNTFYEAEEIKKQKPKEALERFESVILLSERMEEEIKYRFLALQNIVVLSAQVGEYDNMVTKQRLLLKQVNKVAREDLSDAINAVLDAVSTYLKDQPDYQRHMYQMTLEVLKSSNERLWFNICLRLAKIYLDMKNYDLLDSLLAELKDNCRLPGDTQNYDQSKANLLLEVFAMEIQMCTATKNNQRMKHVYPQTLNLNSVINDPRVVGIIKECGGKMYMSEKKWDKALEEMFESFKNYQESGNSRARTVLKYVILASILSRSQINYSETREAKVYKDDSQIISIMNLRNAFENNDINQIQEILADKNSQILDDPFINQYLDDLLRNIRLNVLVARVKPYKSVSLDFLAQQLNVSRDDIRSLLSELILEEKIKGEIDQLNGFLELESSEMTGSQRHVAMRNWAQSLTSLHSQLMKKLPA